MTIRHQQFSSRQNFLHKDNSSKDNLVQGHYMHKELHIQTMPRKDSITPFLFCWNRVHPTVEKLVSKLQLEQHLSPLKIEKILISEASPMQKKYWDLDES